MTSPLPYGVGVYSVDASGSKKDLPLYYVSPKVAAARGDKVKAGWYVAATPGQGFELRLTAVQTDFPKVRGAKLQKGYDVDALVIVDGTRASKRQLKTFGREKTIAGFTESESQEKGKTI